MNKHRFTCWFPVLCSFLLMLPALAFGSGFSINEMGTKAVGMGGAFAAQADDPSAVYYNPAGIVQLEGTQASAGFAIISPSATFETNGTSGIGIGKTIMGFTTPGQDTDIKSKSFLVPNMYITQKCNDKLSFGLGTFANFGLATEYSDDWEGRYIVGGVHSKVKTISLNPVVAFRPFKKFSIAAGAVLQKLDVTLKSKLPTVLIGGPGSPDADVKLSGDNWEMGYNLGFLFWVTDDIKVAASYRSKIKQKIKDGDIKVAGSPGGVIDQEVGANANITLPAITYLGIAWTTGPVTLEFDAQYTEWSEYDKLEAYFDAPVLALGGSQVLSKTKDWNDVWAYRFGADYKLNEMFDIRAGLIYDNSPIPDYTLDPSLPSGDRWLYTFGAGYHSGKLKIDFAYNYLDDDGRTFNNAVGDFTTSGLGKITGEFNDVKAHIFMLNLSYAF